MAFKVRTIEYNESAVSQALDSLFKYSFTASENAKDRNEKAKDRAARMDELTKSNEFTKSQLFLEHSLDNLKNVKSEISALKTTAAEYGLTQVGQENLTDADRTTAFQDITEAGQAEIRTALESLNKVKDSWTGVIGDYNRGRNLASAMDKNISGDIDIDELADYYKQNARYYEIHPYGYDEREFLGDGLTLNPNWQDVIPEGKAFEMGVASWTLNPQVRAEISKTQSEVNILNIESQYTAQALKDQAAQNSLNLALTRTAINAAQNQMYTTKFDLTDSKYTEQMDNLDRMGAKVSADQVSLGVQIMSNISLLDIDEDGVTTPLTTVTSSYLGDSQGLVPGRNDTWSKIIQEDEGGHYPNIKGELVTLASSVVQSKSEDALPDYELMLRTVKEIGELQPSYEKTVTKIRESVFYKGQMNNPRIFKSGTSYTYGEKDAMIVKIILDQDGMSGVISAKESLDAHRFLEWKSTGIFNNPDLLGQANESIAARLEINELKTQLMFNYNNDKGAQSYPNDKNEISTYGMTDEKFKDFLDNMTYEEFMKFLEED